MPRTRNTSGERTRAIQHAHEKRKNIPTAESENLVRPEDARPKPVEYPRRENLNPWLEWTDKNDAPNTLTVDAMPIYVHEKISPQAIIKGLMQQTKDARVESGETAAELFSNFNGLHDPIKRTEFYQHMQNWTNRMILGDSLQVMTSLAEKESLRGKVQCVYIDPPYGIKFSSNWQHSTQTRTVKDTDESREPETIRMFRDTWASGVGSYLSYLRDRLIVVHDLLGNSGSVFVQISAANVHFVRCVLDEVFGNENFIAEIILKTRSTSTAEHIETLNDFILWYAKDKKSVKVRRLYTKQKSVGGHFSMADIDGKIFSRASLSADHLEQARFFASEPLAATSGGAGSNMPFEFQGETYTPPQQRGWRCSLEGLHQLAKYGRISRTNSRRAGTLSIRFKHFYDDFPYSSVSNFWDEQISEQDKVYVVQTGKTAIQRCLLMTTDPGDLVLDPTCGSGTTAFVAEQWGRRWITIDTSRVSLAIARARMMGAKFDYYLLKDSKEGAEKEAEISGKLPDKKTFGENVQHGFVYKRAPHITLRTIANNAEIGIIHECHRAGLEAILAELNATIKQKWQEWEMPAEAPKEWSNKSKNLYAKYITAKQKRQKEMDDSIARNAEVELLYDAPYMNNGIVRVAGGFTVESLYPHRILPPDTEEPSLRAKSERESESRFLDIVRENLLKAGVQNTKKNERLMFTDLTPWTHGAHIQFIGHYSDGKKAAVCVGPQYGTVSKSLLVEAVREAVDYFDMLVILGFAFDAYADNGVMNIGRFPVVRAHMNNDLRMPELSTSDGNLFVAFGEPDIEIRKIDNELYEVEIRGIDIYNPVTGKTKPSETKDIACWFIDTDYNGESFFVRHVYFCGGFDKDPYGRLKRELNTEIDQEAWKSLYSAVSRPFPKPKPKSEGGRGRIAVKAINHYGDEVMKVFDIE